MAIAHVAHLAEGLGANGGTSSAINTSGANLILIAVSWYTVFGDPTISDSKGNTWTARTRRADGSEVACRIYECESPTVGSGHTFTASGANTVATIAVLAVSGAKSGAFDQESGGFPGGNGTSIQIGAFTPSEDNCLVFTTVCTYGDGTPSADGGFTSHGVATLASTYMGGGLAYLIQTTAASAGPTWSWSTSAPRVMAMAAYKAAAGGGGGLVIPVAMNQYRQRVA
jgi:hypothetical protein